MMHKAWNNIKELPYCFRGHPSNFKVTQDKKLQILTQFSVISRSHGLQNDDLNLISVGLFGRSQLSNSLDLPCLPLCIFFEWALSMHTSMNRYSLYFKMAWLSKSQSHYMQQSSFIQFTLDFFRPGNVYSPCPFVFLTETSSSINTQCLPVCLSVCPSVTLR